MLPETHPLIEAVTEPLAENAERRMAAHAFLEEKFDVNHPGAAEATARIEAAGRRKLPGLRKALLWILAVLAIAVLVEPNISTFNFANTVNDYELFDPWEKPELPAGLTEKQRLLLGDPKIDDLAQKRRLHLLAPENPAYFAEHAQTYFSANQTFPPDFLETAANIAPGNAFLIYLSAAQDWEKCITLKPPGATAAPERIVDGVTLLPLPGEMEFAIEDPAAFDKALELIGKAAALPGFETYTNPMIASRVRLLPAKTVTEVSRTLTYAYSGPFEMIQLLRVAYLMNARAEQLSKSGRKEVFLMLAGQREAFISHLGNNPDVMLIGEMIYAVIASSTATNFEVAADRLGLTEMAETYRGQGGAFQQERDLRDIRQKKQNNPFPEEKASVFAGLSIPLVIGQINDPPPLSDAYLEPMRMAEHELLAGIGIFSVALLIVLGALMVFIFRFAAATMIRLPAKRMSGALGLTDWIWVIGLGVVLPILFFLIITRLTPLGGRQYGAGNFLFLFPGLHLLSLLLSLLIAPATVVRWRLSKRLASLGLWDRFTLPLALAALAMIAVWSLVALPFVERFGMEKYSLITLAAPPAFCLALVLANGLRAILGKPAARLAQCTTAVAVLPAYAIAIIALCALTPMYSAGEKRWIARETLLRIDPDAPDLGAYEFKVAAQKRREINAITGVE